MVDIVFPGDTNHHGTLFGGICLAHMDKVAFIAASRHAHVDFVTASCERIDFDAPARLGEIVELTGRVTRVGRRSLSVEVELVAEAPLSGERRRCGRGVFNMVAVGDGLKGSGGVLPPLISGLVPKPDSDLRMVEMVFPEQTSHYGSLYGGNALAAMGKAAFVAATRCCRKTVVMASSQRVDFKSQIHKGEVVELIPRVIAVGRSSMTVEVELGYASPRNGISPQDRQSPRDGKGP
jgi:acyl-CoA hydrolase